MIPKNSQLASVLNEKGITRRQFMQFCGLMAFTLGLPNKAVNEISTALLAATRLPVIWLEFQDCTGDTESFLRASNRIDPLQPSKTDPSITQLVLETISVDYHETIMAAAGYQAEELRTNTLSFKQGQYVCVVEGSIPGGNNGTYCTIGGKTALSIVQEMTRGAKATIAFGTCAWDGGLAAAAPNPTGAVGVKAAVPGLTNLVNISGCPANVVNLVATIVYVLTYNTLPALGSDGRPTFAFRSEIHEHCEREHYFENNQFVEAWGDAGHRQGWCLRHMGCRGPETRSNCPTVKYNNGTNWAIGAGHGCVGCTNAKFWDTMTPFYARRSGD